MEKDDDKIGLPKEYFCPNFSEEFHYKLTKQQAETILECAKGILSMATHMGISLAEIREKEARTIVDIMTGKDRDPDVMDEG